ncbi:MAG: hypothetical protein RIS47_513 [Bacteroidota bacterium]|jgi:hypothetical protein
MRNNLLWLLAILYVVSSCTVDENYTIKNDFSGSCKVDVNLAGYLANISEFDALTAVQDTISLEAKKQVAYLSKQNGVTAPSFVFDKDNGLFSLNFGFKNLDNLTALVKKANADGRLVFEEPNIETDADNDVSETDDVSDLDQDVTVQENPMGYVFAKTGSKQFTFTLANAPDQDALDVAMSTDVYSYKLTFKFESKILKVSHTAAEIAADGKSFSIMKKELFTPQNMIVVDLQ